MGVFRHHMRKGRAALHERMSVPAFAFYEAPVIPEGIAASFDLMLSAFSSEPVPEAPISNPFFGRFTIRPHEKWGLHGDLKGTNFHYAEVEEVMPKLILWRSEWQEFMDAGYPFRNLILSVEPGIAYQIDSAKPHDDLTITVNALRMEPKKTVGFPVPEVL